MYTTRPLSAFKDSGAAAARQVAEQEGPASGCLLLPDEAPEPPVTCCWGACSWADTRVRQLPLPQNKILTLSDPERREERSDACSSAVLFIPVPAQPLSSSRYYVVVARGRDRGKAYACSKEDEMNTCCFGQCINDASPRALDHRDVYQQMEIVCYKGRFTAKPVAADGIPPAVLRKEYWELHRSEHEGIALAEAAGVDNALRARPPPPVGGADRNAVVGRWYTPFVFVKEEGMSAGEQVEESAYYEVALEQFWEEVGGCDKADGEGRMAEVKGVVRGGTAYLKGKEAKCYDTHDMDGLVWFKAMEGEESVVKLSFPVWERMKWEERRGGWDGEEEEVAVERVEEYRGGGGGWRRYGCYVLVERFVLRRMDGSVVLMVDFKHCQKVKSIWE